MAEFKDAIRAAGGKLEYLHQSDGRLAFQISGDMRALYMVAVSMDGLRLLDTVPAVGYGQAAVYPQPSVVAYVQSDEQGMWGRNCPACERYFRTTHIFHTSVCPYCAKPAPSLTFISKAQRLYIAASYDAFARAMLTGKNTSLDLADVTDATPAWHYAEEKQQTHFKCQTDGCDIETDILGIYGYCPRCGRTNARPAFNDAMTRMLTRWDQTDKTVTDQWFDIGVITWNGNAKIPPRAVRQLELPFITKMLQRRHILIHNSGIVDDDYIKLSSDKQVRLDERIRIPSNEAKHFVEVIREMGLNLLDGVEFGFEEA